jgi:hypothetical protein
MERHVRKSGPCLRDALTATVDSSEILRKESKLDELEQARSGAAAYVEDTRLIPIELKALKRAYVRALERERLERYAGIRQRIVSIRSVGLVIVFVQPLTSRTSPV